MKKLLALLLLAALVCTLTACARETAGETIISDGQSAADDAQAAEPAPDETGREETQPAPSAAADPLVGTWVCGEATLEVARRGAAYFCRIRLADSDAELSEWSYVCSRIGETLSADGTGVKKELRYGEDGAPLSAVTVYTDGTAVFSRGADGSFLWDDRRDGAGEGLVFAYTAPAESAPDIDALVSDFYLTVGSYHQGVAGASLAMANAACGTLRFAAAHRLWCADAAALREAMLGAWDRLEEQQRADFVANYLSVIELIDDCTADWGASRGRFDDAGSGEEMTALLDDPMTEISWGVLREAALGLKSTFE